jgi:hypothetical protein
VLASTATATLPRWLAGVAAGSSALAAGVGFGLGALVTPSSISDEKVDTPYIFYHGTSVASGLGLLKGEPLSVDVALALKKGGALGFYLATDWRDAYHFAGVREGTILQYTVSTRAVQELTAAGAVFRPIAPADIRFFGEEWFIPPMAFPLFDSLRTAGQITAAPFFPPE